MLSSAGEKPLFSQKPDIWSLGCIFFEIIVFQKAFRDDYAILQYVEFHCEQLKPAIPASYFSLSHALEQSVPHLLEGMLSLLPQDRPTASELKKMFSTTPLTILESINMPPGRFPSSPKPSYVALVTFVSTIMVVCSSGFGVADDYQNWVNLVTYSFASTSASLFIWHFYFRRRNKSALIWYRLALWARLFQVNSIIVYWIMVVRDHQLHQRCWLMDGVVTMRNTFQLSC
jgi:serine/threonine protein kinase